jgi:hypothetical protein
MPAPQRLRCDEEAAPTVAWENAADGGEQSAVGGFQLGAGGLSLEDGELMAEHQDLQVLGGVTASEQREELEGAAQREVDDSGQHADSLRGGWGPGARYRNQHPNPQLTGHTTVSAPYAQATMPAACWRRNARHVMAFGRGAGSSLWRRSVVRIAVAETWTPSRSSSPWMRW